MTPITKIVIFLAVALIIIIGITLATRSAVAPGTTENTSSSSIPNIPSSPATTATTSHIYTMAEVALHKTLTSCWTAIKGSVYDLTPFINQHPGGIPNITKLCGIEGTTLFMAQHSGQKKPENQLISLKIGTLAQ